MDDMIQKYWTGETNIQEELSLKKDAPYRQDEDQEYFKLLSDFNAIEPSENMLQPLWNEVEKPKTTKVTRLRPKTWLRAASMVVAISLAGWYWQSQHSARSYTDTEVRLAYEQTKLSLAVLSNKLNNNAQLSTQNLAKFSSTQKRIQK